jgi:hypothetical protein
VKGEDQIKAIAELDGISLFDARVCECAFARHSKGQMEAQDCQNISVQFPHYLTSRDAIVPVIEKQHIGIKKRIVINLSMKLAAHPDRDCNLLLATPAQLCEALLRATGKRKE